MNHGIHIAAAGMKSRMQALDVSANNLANVNTVGFKKDSVFYGIFNRVQGTSLEKALADSTVIERVQTDFTVGPMIQTGNALDLALPAEGFFVVRTPDGDRYTRNGEFTLNGQREIVNAQGFPVLGERGPLVVPEGEVQVGESGDVSIEGATVGRLQIVHFEDTSLLRKVGGVLFEALPQAVETRPLRLMVKQGFLEGSNVNPMQGVSDAILNMRNFEMLSRALRSLSEEVNRRVIEEVGRV